MSKLQTLIAACGKPLLAIGLHNQDVEAAKRERRVAWIEIERTMGVDRCRITFTGDDAPDLVFPKPIPDELRETIEEPGWVKPDDVLASIGVE
ncbi:MAG TPA: hypothetical protein VIV11_13160 [Kofleriaceae bacterium]